MDSGYRHLTAAEVVVLTNNGNFSEDSNYLNVQVSREAFDASLVHGSEFYGQVRLGNLRRENIKYHDLELPCGIYRSSLKDVVTGNQCAIHNVTYLVNYHLGNNVMLFNVQEMSTTSHSKFGVGDHWIQVCNENGGRAVLPFASMITADAYLWSHYRDDKELQNAFIAMTSFNPHPAPVPPDGMPAMYGQVGNGAVIKNTTLIKDALIGDRAYIKGAFKLKNITVLSSVDESSQIGEGVEMVNGVLGYNSRVFYQAVAVRFVIGRNCQLKYGARLLNSVLGDNSTVSCCELLNNLIFPFHEQHHNSSFLIAADIGGQSNIAAGATIGSNHNSRSPDGEIVAHRGFWPGLCSDFKHNSRFASFVLAAKGSYQNELDIIYPFSLLTPADEKGRVHITCAWYFMYDMFAIVRNRYKFVDRDKRKIKVQHIETDPLAPDTCQEIAAALERLISLTAEALKKPLAEAKDYLHKADENAPLTLFDSKAQRKHGALILKPIKAYRMYRAVVKYFAAREIVRHGMNMDAAVNSGRQDVTAMLMSIKATRLCTKWVNAGGQIIAEDDIDKLRSDIKSNKINSWDGVHRFYDERQSEYDALKCRYAVYLLEYLYSRPVEEFTQAVYDDIIKDVVEIANTMYTSALSSRQKDFTNYYRKMTYRNDEEMEAVLGKADDSPFLMTLKADTQKFNEDVKRTFSKTAAPLVK